MNIAVYHYAHYTNATEAVNEANYFANIIQKFGLSNDTVVVDDLESSETAVASAAANTRAFFNQLSNRGYDNHVLYTFVSYQQRDNVISVVGNDRVWMAQYPYTPSRNNLWNTQYGAWQFSSTVTIPGLSGYFDASIDYKNIFNQASDKPHEVYQNGHWYLQQDGKNLTGFQTIYDNTLHHDKTVYYNAQGQMQFGEQYINGHWYLFANGTGAMETGFQTVYDGQGQMQFGEQYINGHWYLFANGTGAMETGFQTVYDGGLHCNKTVYYNDQGQMQYGQQYINGHWYYSGMRLSGFQTVYDGNLKHDKTVYYNAQGQMLYGWQTIDGKKYYFAPGSGALQN